MMMRRLTCWMSVLCLVGLLGFSTGCGKKTEKTNGKTKTPAADKTKTDENTDKTGKDPILPNGNESDSGTKDDLR